MNKSIIINLTITFIFVSTNLFSQELKTDTIQWLIFNENPDIIYDSEIGKQTKPSLYFNLIVEKLNPVSCNDSIVKYIDKTNNQEILIYSNYFQPDKHKYDFTKYLIDGKIAFGHDGFSSIDYVNNNFYNQLTGIIIIDTKSAKEINIVNSDFPVFINPSLTNYDGNCGVELFKVEKYFKYFLIISGGGGGAGSYENYILIDIYDRGWIYTKDIYTETVSFVPISNQKDPFLKKVKNNWYKIIFK